MDKMARLNEVTEPGRRRPSNRALAIWSLFAVALELSGIAAMILAPKASAFPALDDRAVRASCLMIGGLLFAGGLFGVVTCAWALFSKRKARGGNTMEDWTLRTSAIPVSVSVLLSVPALFFGFSVAWFLFFSTCCSDRMP